MPSLNRMIARNAFWTIGLRVFLRGVGLISTLILARLLTPQDFGLVAMATAIHALLGVLSDFSFHIPLIQRPDLDRAHLNSAWTLQIMIGLVQAICLALIARPAASFYGDSRLMPLILALVAIALIQAFRNIGVVMFQREMNFSKEFKLRAAKKLAAFFTTVSLALIYQSYWVLIAGMTSAALAELILTYLMQPYRPSLCLKHSRELLSFSKWILLDKLLAFLFARGPDFLLGRTSGAAAVGLFSVSKDLAHLPTQELAQPVNKAVLPAYSRMNEKRGALQQGYVDVIGMIVLLALPAGLGICATADLLVPVLLGAKWADSVPLVELLALNGTVAAMLSNTNVIFWSMGRPHLNTYLSLARLALVGPAMLIGAYHNGVLGVAMGYLFATILMLPINLVLLHRTLDMQLRRFVSAVWRPVTAAIFMYGLLQAIILPTVADTASLPSVVIAIVSGAALFIAATLLFWILAGRPDGAEKKLMSVSAEKLKTHVPEAHTYLTRLIGYLKH